MGCPLQATTRAIKARQLAKHAFGHPFIVRRADEIERRQNTSHNQQEQPPEMLTYRFLESFRRNHTAKMGKRKQKWGISQKNN